ncbi:MAG: hypothetical protein ABEK16_01920 [Candidatus Nanohalobium sp.]
MKILDPESRKIIFLPLVNLLVLESASVSIFGIDPLNLAFVFMIFSAVARTTGKDLEVDAEVSKMEKEILEETGKLLNFSLYHIVTIFCAVMVLLISILSLFLTIKNIHLIQGSVYRLVGLSSIMFQVYFWSEIVWGAVLAVSTAVKTGKEESWDIIRSN